MAKELKPLYYIFGDEDFLVEEHVRSIKSSALTSGSESMNLHIAESKSVDANHMVAEAQTMPAFSPYRVVIIKDSDKLNKESEKIFAEYAKNPSPSTVLIFTASTWKVGKTGALYKAIDKNGQILNCYPLRDRELAQWISKVAAKDGKKISPDASSKLAYITDGRLREVKKELEKIICFVGDKETIETSDVEAAGMDVKEDNIFDLSDALGRKDLTEATRVLEKLSGEQPVMVLGAITRQFRMLLQIKSLLNKGVNPQSIAGTLRVSPKFINSYIARSKMFSLNELKNVFKKLLDTDKSIKSSTLPRGLILSELVIGLCVKGS